MLRRILAVLGKINISRDWQFSPTNDSVRLKIFPMKTYYVYMVTGWNNKVLYTGVTNDLVRRIHEHREKAIPGFTNRYNLNRLVFFESTADVYAAIAREKEIKGWRREKKNALIATMNPDWHDLAIEFGILDP
ncbi:MAG: GIY-YIG nuclease family protein [Anaerolineaceae bacterium]|nr:GIY-YIG nuclease family protein [Anaerolineaceae bacterium]MDD4042323.1 GIY-YIG nuclease family protein [Anaerolineaceae bacterium]MDD4577742.1 GIY-YIG nuclease family protein [Anaerolineaceae bacterium]